MSDVFSSENVKDFLKFRKMITPVIIQVLFWVGVGVSVISGLVIMASGFVNYYNRGASFLGGLLVILLGPVIVRIYCELLILFFRMNETLTEIKNGLSKK